MKKKKNKRIKNWKLLKLKYKEKHKGIAEKNREKKKQNEVEIKKIIWNKEENHNQPNAINNKITCKKQICSLKSDF